MVILSIFACIIQQSGFAELVTHFHHLREMIRQSGGFGYALYILLFLKYFGETAIFQAIERGIERSGCDFLILTRLVPLFPYNIQNYAYGLTAISFWSFTFISAITTLPGIFIYTLMASELIRDGITSLFVLKLTLAGLVLFVLIQAAKRYARYRRIDTQRWRINDEK